ncbi:MAG: bifunctional phosphoribosylaminoimidazolecarboxamide formyltransferase/IMP cyclohydrolase [Terriglobia bacterium]
MKKVTRALISVSDKQGVAEFARGLARLGVEIVSTGGTANLLRQGGLSVRDVAELTGFPEMLDGRVKTLHPKVHGGILAVRSNAAHRKQVEEQGIGFIDLVAVNLYPFERAAARPGVEMNELIENIDIGGPSMIRSAAKNFEDVVVVVDPADYASILGEAERSAGAISGETRARLARKAFARTAAYDAAIASELDRREGQSGLPNTLRFNFPKIRDLRYGENPHQTAALYADPAVAGHGVASAQQLHGKELSFNNLVDLDAAWQLAAEFEEPATAIIKHTNPCGAALGATLAESYRRALAVDPVSAFGSVIAFNRRVDAETAAELAALFTEAIAAPGFDPAALELLQKKKNLRLMQMPDTAAETPQGLQLKTVSGGLLVQTPDTADSPENAEANEWKCVTERQPEPAERRALCFAWRVVKHVKSNAIVFAREGTLASVGAGQMSRVDAVRFAVIKARELEHDLGGAVVASDAFFPFPDSVEAAAQAGAAAVVQPGGSVRDTEVIAAANRLGLAMLFTGTRHFRH